MTSTAVRAGLALLVGGLALGAAAPGGPAAGAVAPKLRLVGDSTMADKPTMPPNPEHGWGQLLPRFFSDPARVVNYALNGRSTKSFIDEGHWARMLAALQPGDFVIIEFGHNDEKSHDPLRAAPARGAYADNLRRFVREVREKHATPVLATPVARRKFIDGRLVPTHGDYPAVVHEVGHELDVPVLELEKLTSEMETAAGEEGSKALHLWIPAGTYERQPAGWKDDTHYSEKGAAQAAALAVQEIRRLKLPLVAGLK